MKIVLKKVLVYNKHIEYNVYKSGLTTISIAFEI